MYFSTIKYIKKSYKKQIWNSDINYISFFKKKTENQTLHIRLQN